MAILLGSIPFTFFLLCAALIFQIRRKEKGDLDIRVDLVIACILSSIWLVAGTELLSLFTAISFWPVLLWWTTPSVAMFIFLARRRKQIAEISAVIPQLDLLDWLLLVPTIVLLFSVGLSAWFSSPNNWDSMLYHLPRQVYWIQHHSVAHYSTTRTLQILMPPFSEFMGMHLMLLSGGDRWANMVQFFSIAMVMVVVTLIARDLGAGRKGQILAAFLVSSMPTAYISASNTKNDVVLALWVCLLAWWAVRIFVDRDHGAVRALLVGATLGLALLTKGTSYFFMPAICLLIGAGIIRSTRRVIRPAMIIVITAILVNSGHWARNYTMFGSPIGYNDHIERDVNELFGPTALMSNLIRNVTLHLGTPWEGLNSRLERGVNTAHALLGIDPQDRRTTITTTKFEISYIPQIEDCTPSGAHVVLIALTLILAHPFRRRRPKPLFYMYLTIPCAGFVLFCLMLQWTPWHSRLHIPLLCLFMPAAAVMLTRKPGVFLSPLVMIGVLVSLYPTFIDNYRPLLGERSVFKTDQTSEMFRARPNLLACSVATADFVAKFKPRTVGLGLDWEYPLQRLIMDRTETPPKFCSYKARWRKHPQAKTWPIDPESPEIVIEMDWFPLIFSDRPTGAMYRLAAVMEPYGIFAREDVAEHTDFQGPVTPFFGWAFVKGLYKEEGPLPQARLPIVRWGGGRRTTIGFEADGSPLVLVMTCGKHYLEWQEIEIFLNRKPVAQYRFDTEGEFKEIKLPLSTCPGRNILTIRYQNQDENIPNMPRALLFKRLQIMPPELVQ